MRTWWAQRWQRLLMIAWRVLDRLRRSIALSQVWLEQRITGWGDENAFIASASNEIMFDEEPPEHWVALVRNNAPWLLRPRRHESVDNHRLMPSGEMRRDAALGRHSDTPQSQRGDASGSIYLDKVSDFDIDEVEGEAHVTPERPGPDNTTANTQNRKPSSERMVPRKKPLLERLVPRSLRETLSGNNSAEPHPVEEPAGEVPNDFQSSEVEVTQHIEANDNHFDFVRPKGTTLTTARRRGKHNSRIDYQNTSLAETYTDIFHIEPEYKKQKSPLNPETSRVETVTVKSVWPSLPGEDGEVEVFDERWPSLDQGSMADGDDSFAQQEGVEWH